MSSTLFVRNLSKHVTSTDLENHFGGIGPLRRAFVVTDSRSDECRGYGFVHFALVGDAKDALNSLNGSIIRGRRITLDLAKKRTRGEEKKDKEITKEDETEKQKPRTIQKQKGQLLGSVAMRTVVLCKHEKQTTITEDEARKAVKADRENSGLERVLLSGNGHEARCTFSTWTKAGQAAAIAHGNDYDAVVEALKGGNRTRLIVRNLPFKINYQELFGTFQAIAPVREVKLANSEVLLKRKKKQQGKNNETKNKVGSTADNDEEKPNKMNSNNKNPTTDENSEQLTECGGYAFVEYFLVADAKHAIKRLNGTKIGGRVIAVDIAVGKSSYKYMSMEDVEKEEKEVSDSSNEEVESQQEDDIKTESRDYLSQDDENDEETCDDATDSKLKKEASSTPEELQRTVFIRNISFETSNKELRKAMIDEFGKVEQAVIVVHPITKRPRGTAFVRFVSEESAEKAASTLKENEKAEIELTAQKHSSSFMLHGRPLLISKAVDRTKANELVANSKKVNKDEDPRNMRLAWIGRVEANTAEAKGMSAEDIERRQKAEKEKKKKLAHNPNAFISDVRLCIRNLPKVFDEKILRMIFRLAAQGVIRGRSASEKDKDSKEKSLGKINHCTIVQDKERNRTRGFGFVQFEKHEDALKALEVVNNNVKILDCLLKANSKELKLDDNEKRLILKQWGSNRRLIVDFAVEDRRIVRMLEKAKQNKKIRNNSKTDNENNKDDTKRRGKSERKAELKRKRAQASNENIEELATRTGKKSRKENEGESSKKKDKSNIVAVSAKRKRKLNEENGENGRHIKVNQVKKKQRSNKANPSANESFDSLVSAYRKRLATRQVSAVKDEANCNEKKTTRWFDVQT